jgi:hypothetical protein
MLIGGAGLSLVAMAILYEEGRRAVAPASTEHRVREYVLKSCAMGGMLIGLSVFQAEFDFGVPQFRLVLQPLLIALAAGFTLTVARLWIGRGGAVAAVLFYLLVRGGVSVVVGPVLGELWAAVPLYLVEALCAEAAALLLIRRSSSPIIYVTTTSRANPRGIRVKRVRQLHPEEVMVKHGIPVTSVARTLLDLAAVLPLDQLRRAAEQAERLGLLDLIAIRRLLARNPRRRGAKRLRAALSGWIAPPDVRSDWERDLPDFCAKHDIPQPQLNQIVEGYLVDALWREQKVVVELDSWAFHRSPRSFHEDRRKFARLQLAEYIVLPITRLDDEAAQMISAAVAAR